MSFGFFLFVCLFVFHFLSFPLDSCNHQSMAIWAYNDPAEFGVATTFMTVGMGLYIFTDFRFVEPRSAIQGLGELCCCRIRTPMVMSWQA